MGSSMWMTAMLDLELPAYIVQTEDMPCPEIQRTEEDWWFRLFTNKASAESYIELLEPLAVACTCTPINDLETLAELLREYRAIAGFLLQSIPLTQSGITIPRDRFFDELRHQPDVPPA